MILATALLTLFSAATFAGKVIAEGKTFTALGDYRIESSDNPMLIKGEVCRTYTVNYENSPMKVTIAVCKDRNCRRYVVLSDKLSVQYVCNPGYFGVEKLDRTFAGEGLRTSDEELNRVEYFHQKVLSPGKRDEIEATQLIAAYFPMLLNNQADAVALR